MTKTAKLFTTGGSQAVRLPKEFRFPGKTVTLRRTAKGVLITPHDDLEERRARFLKLAGSCPDFPDIPRHTTPDLPRNFAE
jgi:antitoxin VapB